MRKISTSVAAVTAATLLLTFACSSGGASAADDSSSTPTNAAIEQASSQAAAADAALQHMTSLQSAYAQAYSNAKAAIPGLQQALANAEAAESKAYSDYQHATSANRTALKRAYTKSITARQAAAKNLTNGQNLYYADGHRLDYANKTLAQDQAAATSADTLLANVKAIYYVDGTSQSLMTPALASDLTFSGRGVDNNWSVYNTAYDSGDTSRTPANVTVDGGVLKLMSSGQSGAGLCLCGPARMSSPYGGYEVRIKVSPNSDHGPAVMLWPDSGNWPTDGEIDMAEFDAARTKALYTLHWSSNDYERHLWTAGNFTQWHTFRLDWTPRGIAYYIDGNIISATTESQIIPTTAMHLSIQMGPSDDNPSNTSSTLQVAWVKTYTVS